MSRGYPDDFGQSIFPGYGTPLLHNHSVTLAGGVQEGNLIFNGAGVLTELTFKLAMTSIIDAHTVRLYLDTYELAQISPYDLISTPTQKYDPSIIHYDYLSEDDLIFQCSLAREIQCHDSITYSLENVGGGNVTFTVQGVYYLVR